MWLYKAIKDLGITGRNYKFTWKALLQPVKRMYNSLVSQRILSIDAFRGLTILVMIFVNEVAGVKDLPSWIKHAPADADTMTFVDVVFPAFLFIVGMSIPFAINNRLLQGESLGDIHKHIAFRSLGLLVLGVFMVNAEGGYNEAAMGISIYMWSLLFYTAVILVWNMYKSTNKVTVYGLRITGVMLLVVLAIIFRGGEDGSEILRPQWWGILGLIGWSYLVASLLYQASKGSVFILLLMVAVCLVFYVVGHLEGVRTSLVIRWMHEQTGHAVHILITLCGVVLSLMLFEQGKFKTGARRFVEVLAFLVALAVIGFLLRPYYLISKIHATPSWGLYSATCCVAVFALLYWIVDVRKFQGWTSFFKPAASNPLLAYIIPFIVYAFMKTAGLSFPESFYQGVGGVVWAAVYAVAVMGIVIGLNRLNIRLQL